MVMLVLEGGWNMKDMGVLVWCGRWMWMYIGLGWVSEFVFG
jgi:hypothetical protein